MLRHSWTLVGFVVAILAPATLLAAPNTVGLLGDELEPNDTLTAPVIRDLGPMFMETSPFLSSAADGALGDVNGDGHLDIVTVGGTIYLNDGFGSFSTRYSVFALSDSRSVALGDLDADGDLDLVVTNGFSTPDRVYWNDGTGIFADSGQRLGAESTPDAVLSDLDGDGDLDLAAATLQLGVRIWLNDGWGTFLDGGSAGSGGVLTLAVRDLNGDGALDLAACKSSMPVEVWWGDGAGRFTDSGLRLGLATLNTFAADFDGDGYLDIGLSNFDGTSQLWRGDGRGGFTDGGPLLSGAPAILAAIGDVDGDGRLDLVTSPGSAASPGWEGPRVHYADRNGGFLPPTWSEWLGGGPAARFSWATSPETATSTPSCRVQADPCGSTSARSPAEAHRACQD